MREIFIMKYSRVFFIIFGLLIFWQIIVTITSVPFYILPSPVSVMLTIHKKHTLLLEHAAITFLEIILGMLSGTILGCASALILIRSNTARNWLLPLLVISQAIPVFAIAPILVLWLGYGLASKVAMACMIIYFPVTAAFYDGLKQTSKGWLDLAHVMGGSKFSTLCHIQIPASLPALATGLRTATAIAPIGAIVGEWVGSSQGLGYLMLHANARMQVDLLFAALLVLAAFAVSFYLLIDHYLRRITIWHHPHEIST